MKLDKNKDDSVIQIIGVLGTDFPNKSSSTLGTTLTKDFLGN